MPKSPEVDERQREILAQFFKKISGDDMEVDAFELQEVLTYILKKGKVIKLLVSDQMGGWLIDVIGIITVELGVQNA